MSCLLGVIFLAINIKNLYIGLSILIYLVVMLIFLFLMNKKVWKEQNVMLR